MESSSFLREGVSVPEGRRDWGGGGQTTEGNEFGERVWEDAIIWETSTGTLMRRAERTA